MSVSVDIRERLKDAFAWRGDRTDEHRLADLTGWWRDPALLMQLGPALADLSGSSSVSLVLGPQSSGAMLGALVATSLHVGLERVCQRLAGWWATLDECCVPTRSRTSCGS
ncbi:adenine phosphoribosyltransferase [Modestobacter sp. DSM 44400]|nr:adenine phosphoribosyltransferase [Modestobacter sp. DSM 44400]